jgi:siroheme synthase-like protein
MRYYPLFADLNGRNCLLIGEGKMIEGKSDSLEKSGAIVRKRTCFCEEDATDVFLIVADVAEDQAAEIQAFGERNRIFVNIVDKPKYCSFIIPAIVKQKDLLIAISTAGRSPALAGWIRQRFQQDFGPEYGLLLEAFGETREDVKGVLKGYGDRKDFYLKLLEGDILDLARHQGKQAVLKALNQRLEQFKETRRLHSEP